MVSTAMRALAKSLVRQQNSAGDVADGVNEFIGGPLVSIHLDEALFVAGDLGVFKAEVVGIGHAADGDEDAVVKFLTSSGLQFPFQL